MRITPKRTERRMAHGGWTPDFSLKVSEVEGLCPAGEIYAKRNIAENKIPVLSCEGPCIRGAVQYKEYSDVFLYTDVPEDARNELARKVADQILEKLRKE